MTLQEKIQLSKEAKKISEETGRSFKEVFEDMKGNDVKKTTKLDLSKAVNMCAKDKKKWEDREKRANMKIKTCNPNELGEINKARAFAEWNR